MNTGIDELKRIVSEWAKDIPYGMAVLLFGSYLKGDPNFRDVDIAIVLTQSLSQIEIGCISVEEALTWEKELAEKTGLPISVQVYDPDRHGGLEQYLREGPRLLLCQTVAPDIGEEYLQKDLAVLLSNE